MLYLMKGHPAFARPARDSQSHGNALTDVPVIIIDAQKFYPWCEIKPISQENISLKIDPNYPDWFVDMSRDTSPEKPGTVTPPAPTVEFNEELVGQSFVYLMRYIASLFK